MRITSSRTCKATKGIRSDKLPGSDVSSYSYRPVFFLFHNMKLRGIACLVTGGSVDGGVFSAVNDMLVEHALLAAAVCALLSLFLAVTQLAAGTSEDVLPRCFTMMMMKDIICQL